jgi:ElaA protein
VARRPIRIAAQHRLEHFYAEFGFRAASDPYEEDGIPHLDMLAGASA